MPDVWLLLIDLLRSAGSSWSILSAGIANPMFWACEVPLASAATAVFMAMTLPELSTSGPPDSRVDGGIGLEHVGQRLGPIARRVARLHGAALGRDDSLGHRRRAGRSPRALPIATTASPTWTLSEFP